MAEEGGSSISFYTPSADDKDASESLVAFSDCEIIEINSEMVMVINRQNGNQLIISPQVAEGLKTCTNFKTITAHAQHLTRTRPELKGQETVAVSALEQLDTAGILLHASDISARLAQESARELPPTRVFVTTCDRPAALERLLQSMRQVKELAQHDNVFVVDDSRASENRDANRELVGGFNRTSVREIHYIGASEQQALIEGLIARLPECERDIRFLLDAQMWQDFATFGRARNVCLMFSVGHRALMIDDDVLLETILSPIAEKGVSVGAIGVRQAGFFESKDEMFSAVKRADFDPLSGHARFLGSHLSSALKELNEGSFAAEQLQDCSASVANAFEPESPILVTQNGTLGDPGTGSVHWGLTLDDASLRRLAQEPQGVRAALENRLVWLGCTRAKFFKLSVISQITGLDNSYLLPPYFPVFRGEDMLFGAMLLSMHPDGAVLEYPWGVPHLPVEERSFSVDDAFECGGHLGQVSQWIASSADPQSGATPEQNLTRLSSELERVSMRSDERLRLDFRASLARSHANMLMLYGDRCVAAEGLKSPELQELLDRALEEYNQTLSSPSSPLEIGGIPEAMTEAEFFSRFREMAHGFAGALASWSEVREVAAEVSQDLVNSREMIPL